MNAFDVVVAVVLFVGVGCEVVCALGVLLMRGPFDKLHYAAAGTTVGALCIGGAIAARETLHAHGAIEVSSGGIETLVTVAFLFLLNPALTILTARAAHRLERR